LHLLIEHLDAFLPYVSSINIWKLIQSYHRAANLLGADLLQYLDFSKEKLRDIISLANHEMPQIRQYCFDYFNENIGRIRYESTEALSILDSKWEDSREFGFDFFEEHYRASNWTPELLVSICDSTRLDVQEYGKKMIRKYFNSERGLDYLMQLSQHPSIALQYFVTDYLRRYAGNNLHHFIQLKPYFKTVLCQLYKGGSTKKEVFNFIEDEALNDQAIAAHAIEILNDVALSISTRDKARCIQILHAIQTAYPNLNTALRIQSVEVR
jgi:hypothetical protein